MMNVLPKDYAFVNEEVNRKNNDVIGDGYKFANQRQRLFYKPDTYENIRTEFDRFVKDNPPVNSIVDTE